MSSLMGRATLGRCVVFPFLYMSNHLWLVNLFWLEDWESFRVTESWSGGSHLLLMKLFSSTSTLACPSILFTVHELWVLYAFYGTWCVGLVAHLVNDLKIFITLMHKLCRSSLPWCVHCWIKCQSQRRLNLAASNHTLQGQLSCQTQNQL